MPEFFRRIEKESALAEGFTFPVTKRHWGTAITLDANTRVNLIHGEPSAHFHRLRTEEYILYAGTMVVYRGKYFEGNLEKTVANLQGTPMKPGDKVVISPGTVHIPLTMGKDGAVFIEVSHGPYEDADIVRIYDQSGRNAELVATWTKLGHKQGLSIKDLMKKMRGR